MRDHRFRFALDVDEGGEVLSSRLTPLLRATALGGASEEELARLEDSAVFRHAKRRDVIVEQDEPFPHLGLVLDGVVAMTVRGAVSSQRQSRAMRLYEAFPGDLFGEVAVLDEAKTLGRATIITREAHFALLSRDVILAICDRNPRVLRDLSRAAALRARELVRRLTAQATEPISARIASVLLPYAADGSDDLAPAQTFLAELTQAELAATAGTVKEVAARTIAQFEREGALKRERGHITYLCRAKLAQLANP